MQKIFTEFENENSLRTYPFASGCHPEDTTGTAIQNGIFIDATLYPINPTGILYLSCVYSDGRIVISDEKSEKMTATYENGSTTLEFYDNSDFSRHVGTIIASSAEALSSFVNVTEDRKFRVKNTAFSASCVFPIVNDGVLSLKIGDLSKKDGKIEFSNENNAKIRVSTDQNGKKLRFDVIPAPSLLDLGSIQHIYCIVDGKTPFRIQKIPFGTSDSGIGNTVAVYLDGLERSDICNNAHRENSLEMADTCKECESGESCHHDPVEPTEIPYIYQEEVVDIPNGAENAFYLTVPNMIGYDNPLSITMEDGQIVPKTEINVSVDSDNIDELTDNITSKGIVIQVPGLATSI